MDPLLPGKRTMGRTARDRDHETSRCRRIDGGLRHRRRCRLLRRFLPQRPDLQNRIPAPLPPPSLNTFGDRTTQCLELGSGGGLTGSDLDSYVAACMNEN